MAFVTNFFIFAPVFLLALNLRLQPKEAPNLELELFDYKPTQVRPEEERFTQEANTTVREKTEKTKTTLVKTEPSEPLKHEAHSIKHFNPQPSYEEKNTAPSAQNPQREEANTVEKVNVVAPMVQAQRKEEASTAGREKVDAPTAQTYQKEGTGGGSGGKAKEAELSASKGASEYQEHYEAKNWSFIRELVHKHLEYPHVAVLRGWQGRVVIRVCIEGKSLCGLEVRESSGYSILDQSALRAVQKACKNVPYAEQRVYLILPVKFELAEVR
ncbi:MAG: TonB family protein [Aquificaceae bacterium]|nr:TonB family protein [Aquificaceae bacterium]